MHEAKPPTQPSAALLRQLNDKNKKYSPFEDLQPKHRTAHMQIFLDSLARDSHLISNVQ